MSTSYQKGQRIPSFLDLKQILYRNPAFQPCTVLTLDTANRKINTALNNPTWNIPIPVKGVYAVQMKSLTLPVAWPNVTRQVEFEVDYGSVTPFPGNFVLPVGRYSYNLYGGLVTYTQAAAAPVNDYLDDLVYYVLRWFSGAVVSISINPSTGVWIWEWDPSCTSVTVTSGASDVTGFFKIGTFFPLNWQSTGTVDLTGPRNIVIGCSDLAAGGYVSSVTNSQNYLCSCPVPTLNFGDILSHEPSNPNVTWFGVAGKYVSSITLSIIDAATNTLLPLDAEWSVELKFYVDIPQ